MSTSCNVVKFARLVTGLPQDVRAVADRLKHTAQVFQAQHDRSEQEEEDTLELPGHKLQLLQVGEFPAVVSNTIPELKVSFRENGVLFRGLAQEIRDARMKALETLSSCESRHELMAAEIVKLLQTPQTQAYIATKLEGVLATWHVQPDEATVQVHALSEREVLQAIAVLKASVTRCELSLSEESSMLLRDEGGEFRTLVDRLKEPYAGRLHFTVTKNERT